MSLITKTLTNKGKECIFADDYNPVIATLETRSTADAVERPSPLHFWLFLVDMLEV